MAELGDFYRPEKAKVFDHSTELEQPSHELNQEEIEEFEKDNVEDMGIPASGGVASPFKHKAKLTSAEFDGIILDPIAFHSADPDVVAEAMKDQHALNSLNKDKLEDSFLGGSVNADSEHILGSGVSSDSSSSHGQSSDTASESSSRSNSETTSLFETNSNTFLDIVIQEQDMNESTMFGSNAGINKFDKIVKPIRTSTLPDLISECNSQVHRPEIKFDHQRTYQNFETEISDWFVKNEFAKFAVYQEEFFRIVQGHDFGELPGSERESYVRKLVSRLKEFLKNSESFSNNETGVLNIETSLLIAGNNDWLFQKLRYLSKELIIVRQLSYLIFGNYGHSATSRKSQKDAIFEYCDLVLSCGYLPVLLGYIKRYSTIMYLMEPGCSRKIELLKEALELWFLLLSDLYVILTVCLYKYADPGVSSPQFDKVLQNLRDSEILIHFMKYIEKWKWHNKVMMKIRNVLILSDRIVQVEFGNELKMDKVKAFLCKKFDVKRKKKQEMERANLESSSKQETKLVSTPLDYYIYTRDLTSRFPAYTPKAPTYPKTLDNNLSLSQFIEVPRTLDNSFFNSSLPVPIVHIATPAPSPNQSPVFGPTTPQNGTSNGSTGYVNGSGFGVASGGPSGNGGQKGKRSFQTNQSFPFIYPVLEGHSLPKSVEEASDLFYDSVVESLSKKQLWNERSLFMEQERGWKSSINLVDKELGEHNDKDAQKDEKESASEDKAKEKEIEFEIVDSEDCKKQFPEHKEEIDIMDKVELYYQNFFPQLSSFVSVVVQLMKTNDVAYENEILKEHGGQDRFSFDEEPKETQNGEQSSGGSAAGENENINYRLLKQKLEIIRTKEVTLKHACSLLALLMKWLRLSHVLKAENLGTILYDSGFIEAFLQYVPNPCFKEKVFDKEIELYEYNFFDVCSRLCVASSRKRKKYTDKSSFYFYDNLLKSDIALTRYIIGRQELEKFLPYSNGNLEDMMNSLSVKNEENSELSKEEAKHRQELFSDPTKVAYDTSGKIFNHRYCIILDSLLKVLQKVLLNKTRRLVSFSEKQPVDLFRVIVNSFYNYSTYKCTLKILKEIIPFNGKKWKSVNMDLISMIYINLNLKLKDNWLSGRDIDSEISDSEGQELAIRALIQFYTARKYEKGLNHFGYERRNSDFFGRETDLIASIEQTEN